VKIRSFFRSIWRSALHPQEQYATRLPMAMRPLVMALAKTQAKELSCDDVYALLDVYAECLLRGDDVEGLMPLIHHHLAMCPDCAEELSALLRSMETTAM
jgi:hypothetical protein